ncbi:MAG: hypothetical protein ABJA80_07685 [bacterium]
MLVLLAGTAGSAAAQVPAPASQPTAAVVSGRVTSPGLKVDAPVPGVMVTLHRVGPDSSGPVDSIRTDKRGAYTIRYRRFGSEDAVYFAAAVYRGIAYFSAPLQALRVRGEDGAITVFDTTTRAVDLNVRGHHVVVSAPRPDGARNIVEVWELSNDTTVTIIGRDSLSPVWTATLPDGATDFQAGQGDVSASALVARGARVALLAPFGPGVKQLSYSYSLPPSAFPLSLPLERPTVVLEVLAEEPGAQVSGATLHAMDAATTGGRTFKRFLTQDVPAGSRVRIAVPTTTDATRTTVLVGIALALGLAMVAALVRALAGRGQVVRRRVIASGRPSELLLAEIAALDGRSERGDPTLDALSYAENRAALKSQLAAALAAEAGAV